MKRNETKKTRKEKNQKKRINNIRKLYINIYIIKENNIKYNKSQLVNIYKNI